MSVIFLNYGFSSVGPFREYIQLVHANFRGDEVAFVPHIFITNERGILGAREREGYPKLLGEVDFDMGDGNLYGTARLIMHDIAGINVYSRSVMRSSDAAG